MSRPAVFTYKVFNVSALLPDDALLKCVVIEVRLVFKCSYHIVRTVLNNSRLGQCTKLADGRRPISVISVKSIETSERRVTVGGTCPSSHNIY